MYIKLTYYNKYNDPVEYESEYFDEDINKFAKKLCSGKSKEEKKQFADGFVAATEFFDLYDILADYDEFQEFIKEMKYEEASENLNKTIFIKEHDFERDDEL